MRKTIQDFETLLADLEEEFPASKLSTKERLFMGQALYEHWNCGYEDPYINPSQKNIESAYDTMKSIREGFRNMRENYPGNSLLN